MPIQFLLHMVSFVVYFAAAECYIISASCVEWKTFNAKWSKSGISCFFWVIVSYHYHSLLDVT